MNLKPIQKDEMGRMILPREQINAIREYFRDHTVKELAAALQVSYHSACDILRQHEIYKRRGNRAERKDSQKQRARIDEGLKERIKVKRGSKPKPAPLPPCMGPTCWMYNFYCHNRTARHNKKLITRCDAVF